MKSKWSYQKKKKKKKQPHEYKRRGGGGEIIYKGLLYSSISNLCESV